MSLLDTRTGICLRKGYVREIPARVRGWRVPRYTLRVRPVLDTEKGVHRLLVGICGYTDDYIQEVSKFKNIKRGGGIFTEPMTEVYGPSN